MSNSNEPDVFAILMKFLFSCAAYVAATGIVVYIGTKVLRAIGVVP